MLSQRLMLLFAGSALKVPVHIVLLLVVARLLGPERLGQIVYLQAVVAMLTIASDLSLGHTHVKRVSEGKDLGSCLRTYGFLKSVLGGITMLGLGGFFFLHQSGTLQIVEAPLLPIFVALAAAVFFNQFFNQLFLATFQAHQRVATMAMVETITLVIFAVSGIAVLLATNDLFFYSLTFLLREVVLFCLLVPLFIRAFGKDVWRALHERSTLVGSYLRYTSPQSFLVPLGLLNLHVDKLIVKALTSVYEVGLYAAAQRLSIIEHLSKVFASVFFPELSRDFGEGDMAAFSRKVLRAERFLWFVASCVCLPLFVFPQEAIVLTVGVQYAGAELLLPLFLVYSLLSIVTTPYRTVLYASEKNTLNTLTAVGGLVVFVGLSIWLVPQSLFGIQGLGLGAVGIILAQLIKTGLIFLFYKFLSWKFFSIRFSVGWVGYLGIFAGFAMLGTEFTSLSIITRFVLGVSVFGVVVWVLRLVTHEDLKNLRTAFRSKRLYASIREEFSPTETA
ncbi:oligosaccharide flippase family protein [Candidatus Uhrbacteria bacterium]|nr:oligosaccharide flippase family protein [Candidatus Uhrbacteria bacterium]